MRAHSSFSIRRAGIFAACLLLAGCQGRVRVLEQQLELEKQRSTLAEQTLRQQLQSEQALRMQLQQQLASIEQARQMALFNDAEYRQMASSLASSGQTIGRMLLTATHPTGTYVSTGSPSLALSDDRRIVSAQFAVQWRGLLTETPYTTVYRIRLDKQGVERLEVVRDEAIAQVAPEFLRDAEIQLQRFFAANRGG